MLKPFKKINGLCYRVSSRDNFIKERAYSNDTLVPDPILGNDLTVLG